MPGVIAYVPNERPKFVPLAADILTGDLPDVVASVRSALTENLHLGDPTCFRLLFKERDIDTSESIARDFVKASTSGLPCAVRLVFRLLGGKGGFGSLLRSQHGTGKKTTNFDACRDLTGRRLRHSKAVERIKEWMEKKQGDDELVAAIVGEGPELQTPAEQKAASLDPDFVRQLKRSAAEKPKVVCEGMKRATADGAPEKRARLDTGLADAALAGLGSLSGSSDDSGGSGEEEAQVLSSNALSSASASATAAASVAPAAPSPSLRANGAATAAARDSPMYANSSNGEGVAQEAEERANGHRGPRKPSTALESAIEPQGGKEQKEQEEGTHVLLNVEDIAAFRSAEELLQKSTAEILKQSLMRLGLKCGGTPQQRAERLFALKATPLESLPKSMLAPKPSR